MSNTAEITADDIRTSLITRARRYRDLAKTSFSAMGISAVGDSKFLGRVENPEVGFNIKTYQKMVDWLDEAEKKLTDERGAA